MSYKPIPNYDFRSAPKDVEVVKLTKEEVAKYYSDKWSRKYDHGKWYGVKINGVLLCSHLQFMDQSYLIPELYRFTKAQAKALVSFLMRLNYPFPFSVWKFSYDGFGGQCDRKVVMPYTARFKAWSGDPGVALMECSDGKERLIPTFALNHSIALPNDMSRVEGSGHVQFFGLASKSN